MKNAQPKSVALSQTTTSKERANPEKLYEKIKPAGLFLVACGSCGSALNHADLIGRYDGPIFHVTGYKCPACRHTVGRITRKNSKGSTVPFQWQRIVLPRSGSQAVHAGGSD